jgi:hypothetical protein
MWETDTEGASAGVKNRESKIEISSAGIKLQENFSEVERIATNYIENRIGRSLRIPEKENVSASLRIYTRTLLNYQQVASKITALAAGAANQMLGNIPAMAVGRVIIPPPLIKNPAGKALGYATEKQLYHYVDVRADQQQLEVELRKAVAETKQDAEIEDQKKYQISGTTEEDIESIKKYAHKEKIMSTTKYACAIEGYDVSSYDYESGGPVSYTVNLSVLDYKPEYS